MIQSINTQTYIEALSDTQGHCSLGRFTMVESSIRDELDLAEVISATGIRNVVDIINFTPERIALHQTIARIQTEIQITEDNYLAPVTLNVFNNFVSPQIRKFVTRDYERIIQEINDELQKSSERIDNEELFNPLSQYDSAYKQAKELVEKRISEGKYTLGEFVKGETVESIILKVAFDNLYKAIVNEMISIIVINTIRDIVNESIVLEIKENDATTEELYTLVPLKANNEGSERHTFLLSGPPACGKGSAEGIMKVKAKNLGILWKNIVRVNTDNYRPMLSLKMQLGDNKSKHAMLNNDEAKLVAALIKSYYAEKVDNNAAPDLLLDTVNPSQEKIDLGTKNDGMVHIITVSLAPEIAFARAEARGKKTGRFVPFHYMLGSHKKVSSLIESFMLNNMGNKVDFEVYDTNVKWGEKPILLVSGNLANSTIDIHDLAGNAKLYGRKYLNSKAEDVTLIWDENGEKSSLDHVENLNHNNAFINLNIEGQPAFTLYKDNVYYHSDTIDISQITDSQTHAFLDHLLDVGQPIELLLFNCINEISNLVKQGLLNDSIDDTVISTIDFNLEIIRNNSSLVKNKSFIDLLETNFKDVPNNFSDEKEEVLFKLQMTKFVADLNDINVINDLINKVTSDTATTKALSNQITENHEYFINEYIANEVELINKMWLSMHDKFTSQNEVNFFAKLANNLYKDYSGLTFKGSLHQQEVQEEIEGCLQKLGVTSDSNGVIDLQAFNEHMEGFFHHLIETDPSSYNHLSVVENHSHKMAEIITYLGEGDNVHADLLAQEVMGTFGEFDES